MSVLSAREFHDEAAAHVMLEGIVWPKGPVCPKCGGFDRSIPVKGGRVGLYGCGPCKRQFTVKVGTVFEFSHVLLNQWLQVVHIIVSSKKGVSSHQVMRTLDCQYKTVWFTTRRIREAMKALPWLHGGKLGGAERTLEADETLVGGKAENRAYGPIPAKQGVFALVERNGAVRSFHVPNVTANSLAPIIARRAHSDSRFMTDEANVYDRPGRWFVDHQIVNHSDKEYVRGGAYINTLEGYFSIVKARYLWDLSARQRGSFAPLSCREYDFRYTHRVARGVDDLERMRLALASIVGKRLTYRPASTPRRKLEPLWAHSACRIDAYLFHLNGVAESGGMY